MFFPDHRLHRSYLLWPVSQGAQTTATNSAAGKSSTSSTSNPGAANTSKPNAALVVRLPSGGSVVGIVGIVLGAFIF